MIPLPTLTAPPSRPRTLNASGDTWRSLLLWTLAGLVVGVFWPGG